MSENYKCPHCHKEIANPVYGRELGRLKALRLEQEWVEVNRKIKDLGEDGYSWDLNHLKDQLEEQLSMFVWL